MDELEIRRPLADRGRNTLVPPGWIGEILRLGFTVEGGQPCSNRGQIRRGEKPLSLQLHLLMVGYVALLPLAFFLAAGMGGGAGNARHVGVFFPSNL